MKDLNNKKALLSKYVVKLEEAKMRGDFYLKLKYEEIIEKLKKEIKELEMKQKAVFEVCGVVSDYDFEERYITVEVKKEFIFVDVYDDFDDDSINFYLEKEAKITGKIGTTIDGEIKLFLEKIEEA